jgi:hypothetical protein
LALRRISIAAQGEIYMKFFAMTFMSMLIAGAVSAATDIAPNDLHRYVEAAQIGERNFSVYQCQDGNGTVYDVSTITNYILNGLTEATSGTVGNEGDEPVLTFIHVEAEESKREVIKLTSSTDDKQVIGLSITYEEMQNVNTGTFANPSIERQWVKTSGYVCR